MDRRKFLKNVGLAGAALVAPQLDSALAEVPEPEPAATVRPNILVIVVDQMRYPQWFPDQATLDQHLPGLARLRSGAVSFGQHYVAANACTPARGTMLTGLYAHQTSCLLTMTRSGIPALNPGFPTWGTLLRGMGYQTYWYGKWHLSTTPNSTYNLGPYGFSGGTYPSPNGYPYEGRARDPGIVTQFTEWLGQHGNEEPWCTTVSLVNPHDISFYPRYPAARLDRLPSVFKTLPPNFETPEVLGARNAPRLHLVHQESAAQVNGNLAFGGPDWLTGWLQLLDLYFNLTEIIDEQIVRVLDALEARPTIASNTIIIFTSDHGEYAGSHGLRGKGDGVYDESMRVPLYIKDPTGQFAAHPEIERTGLTSSVDLAPLLLTIASGGSGWRSQAPYVHLAGRLDLAGLLLDPAAAGRPYILHTSDEDVIEGSVDSIEAVTVPRHVIGLRTATAKLGTYNFWRPGSLALQSALQESECYDYRSERGRLEIEDASAAEPALRAELYDMLMDDAMPNELRAPLPPNLLEAQQAGQSTYLATRPPSKIFLSQVLS